VFNGQQLMAIAGSRESGSTWRIIQHEGFHQFAHAVIGGDIPVWMNEGLAEYFGESLYTGDGYVTGVAPPQRIRRLQTWIKRGNAISIREMMRMPHMLWNAQMNIVNYDQAWSMVYFLAHGDGGRYQKAFNGFLRDVGRGAGWERAWQRHFGAGTRDFEKRWKTYWLEMKADHSAEMYAEATVATLTSFYARAFAEQQIYRSWPQFVDAAKRGTLKSDARDWLSPELLETALSRLNLLDKIEIRKRNGYQLVARTKLGTELIGTFRVSNKRVFRGSVKVIVRRRGG